MDGGVNVGVDVRPRVGVGIGVGVGVGVGVGANVGVGVGVLPERTAEALRSDPAERCRVTRQRGACELGEALGSTVDGGRLRDTSYASQWLAVRVGLRRVPRGASGRCG